MTAVAGWLARLGGRLRGAVGAKAAGAETLTSTARQPAEVAEWMRVSVAVSPSTPSPAPPSSALRSAVGHPARTGRSRRGLSVVPGPCSKGMEREQPVAVRGDEALAEPLDRRLERQPSPELPRRHAEEGPQVPSETLR